jgi:hypothetical protein
MDDTDIFPLNFDHNNPSLSNAALRSSARQPLENGPNRSTLKVRRNKRLCG